MSCKRSANHRTTNLTVSAGLSGTLAMPVSLPALKTSRMENADAGDQADSPLSNTGSPGAVGKDGKRGRPPGLNSRGRGRGRGRGRPPNAGELIL